MVNYCIEKNEKYGDYRIVIYINGVWDNELDDNWTKSQAEKELKSILQYSLLF